MVNGHLTISNIRWSHRALKRENRAVRRQCHACQS